MSGNIIDLYTEEAVTKILKAWYPYDKINVNEKVALKVYEIIEKSGDCTTIVGGMEKLVGGPIGTSRSLTGSAIKVIRSTLKKASENEHALACIKTSALYYKSEFQYLGL